MPANYVLGDFPAPTVSVTFRSALTCICLAVVCGLYLIVYIVSSYLMSEAQPPQITVRTATLTDGAQRSSPVSPRMVQPQLTNAPSIEQGLRSKKSIRVKQVGIRFTHLYLQSIRLFPLPLLLFISVYMFNSVHPVAAIICMLNMLTHGAVLFLSVLEARKEETQENPKFKWVLGGALALNTLGWVVHVLTRISVNGSGTITGKQNELANLFNEESS